MSILPENVEKFNIPVIENTGQVLFDAKADGTPRPWNQHKNNSRKLYKLYGKAREIDSQCISPSSYRALETCASYLLYKVNIEGEKKLKTADFCRARLCPMCNWRKSLKMFGQTSKITKRMLEKNEGVRFIFVSFTQKNCSGEELRDEIGRMNAAFLNLTSPNRKHAFSANLKKSLLGYMRAIEVTYSKGRKDYHPHIHAIFAVKASYFKGGKYLTHEKWREMWKEAMGLDYLPEVNVKVVKPKKTSQGANVDVSEAKTKEVAIASAVAETAKYPVKMDGILELEDEEAVKVIIVLSKALKGKRLVTFGGIFADVRKELELDDIEEGDLVHTDEDEPDVEEVANILYKFQVKVGCYVC